MVWDLWDLLNFYYGVRLVKFVRFLLWYKVCYILNLVQISSVDDTLCAHWYKAGFPSSSGYPLSGLALLCLEAFVWWISSITRTKSLRWHRANNLLPTTYLLLVYGTLAQIGSSTGKSKPLQTREQTPLRWSDLEATKSIDRIWKLQLEPIAPDSKSHNHLTSLTIKSNKSQKSYIYLTNLPHLTSLSRLTSLTNFTISHKSYTSHKSYKSHKSHKSYKSHKSHKSYISHKSHKSRKSHT